MPTIKGTASVSDDHAMAKLLKKTQFPANFSVEVELSKVNIPVMSQWVERKITELLGFEDEIVASTAINLFLPTTNPAFDAPSVPPKIDPRRAQLNLAGFLGEEDAATFCKELWTLMLDAQETPTGIPRKLLEDTKKEMATRLQRPRSNPTVMNPMVREASRRAEAARQALANAQPRENVAAVMPQAAAAGRNPVPVSPPHPSEQQSPIEPVRRSPSPPRHEDQAHLKRDENEDEPAPRHERNEHRRERDSRRNGSHDESSSDSSTSSSSYDSEEDRRRRRRDRERWRRYEEDEDRRIRRRYERDYRNRDEDEYGRRRRQREDDRPRYHDRDRHRRPSRDGGRDHHDRPSRDHHRRSGDRGSRSRSYSRDDRRRRHRRSRSYSDSS